MPAIDAQIRAYEDEIEERTAFINNILETAGEGDLDATQMRLVSDATARIKSVNAMVEPLRESRQITVESRRNMAELQSMRPRPAVEYRSAGAFVLDHWQAALGVEDARERMTLYRRAAAHQTTADNLGVIPEPISGSILSFVDAQRPIVNALGPLSVPGGRFNRPKVTQHTAVAKQSAEKAELTSQKMLITRVAVAMDTYGGYVNVSRQDIDFSAPNIMDLVIQDLAGQYAVQTENATADGLVAGSTAQTPVITTSSTQAEVTAALWKAVGTAYTNMQGQGRLVLALAPDMMAAFGPLFTPLAQPVNLNSSSGFQAANFGSGIQGTISGILTVVSAGLDAGKALLINTAAAEVYEQRIGSLQVTEPSVLGVQVAYAGYFQFVVLVAGGVIKLSA